VKALFCPVLPNIFKSIALFEAFQASPACPPDKSSRWRWSWSGYRRKTISMLLCLLQISHGLAHDRTRASVVRPTQMTCKSMMLPPRKQAAFATNVSNEQQIAVYKLSGCYEFLKFTIQDYNLSCQWAGFLMWRRTVL
jgi:hypothetical protein